MNDDVKDLQKGITDILVAIGKIETEMKQLSSMASKVDQVVISIAQLDQRTKSAHHRIDELQREFDSYKKATKEDRKWLWGAAVGFVALLISIYKSFKGV